MLSFMNLDAIFYESLCRYMYEKYVLLLYLKHKNLFIRESFNISYYKMVLATYMLSKIDFLIIIISGQGLLWNIRLLWWVDVNHGDLLLKKNRVSLSMDAKY